MSAIWTIFIALAVTLTTREARKEKREFIKRNGMSRGQMLRAIKYMKGQYGKVSYKELLQNMNNN
jgi:hypothetical protein